MVLMVGMLSIYGMLAVQLYQLGVATQGTFQARERGTRPTPTAN